MTPDPFAVLEIEATRDLGVVKRAYFSLLPKHPPETDPLGFRRLRDAYEQLSSPRSLAAAYLSAPVDLAALERAYAGRFDARIAELARLADAQQTTGAAEQQFIDRFSSQSWEEALRSLTGP